MSGREGVRIRLRVVPACGIAVCSVACLEWFGRRAGHPFPYGPIVETVLPLEIQTAKEAKERMAPLEEIS